MVKNNSTFRKNKIDNSIFPPLEEFERAVKRISKSEKKTNIGLPPNASPIEKAKYNFCQTLARYRRENNLLEKTFARQLGINLPRLDSILYSHIDEFTLDELAGYVSSLHIPFELRVIDYGQKEASLKAH